MIPYGRQDIDEADIEAVISVLKSDWLTQGPAVEIFENRLTNACGAAHAVVTCNATAALHLACRALGLGPGDVLWTVPNTFVASANCALYCGASVDFVDVEADTGNMDMEALRRKLEQADRSGELPKIVVPVDFAGHPVDLCSLDTLRRRYGFAILEDASHALGGKYSGKPIGGGRLADITIFSFHPVKIVTSGEGGAAVTDDTELANKMRLLRSHGITRESACMVFEKTGPWYYEQIDLGYNYRLSDIHAALGASQLRKLERYVSDRNRLAEVYSESLSHLPIDLPVVRSNCFSAYHLYVVRLRRTETAITRSSVINKLHAAGVMATVHYIPVHLQPYYRKMGFALGDFPVAELRYETGLSLPLFPTLTDTDQAHVIAMLDSIFEN